MTTVTSSAAIGQTLRSLQHTTKATICPFPVAIFTKEEWEKRKDKHEVKWAEDFGLKCHKHYYEGENDDVVDIMLIARDLPGNVLTSLDVAAVAVIKGHVGVPVLIQDPGLEIEERDGQIWEINGRFLGMAPNEDFWRLDDIWNVVSSSFLVDVAYMFVEAANHKKLPVTTLWFGNGKSRPQERPQGGSMSAEERNLQATIEWIQKVGSLDQERMQSPNSKDTRTEGLHEVNIRWFQRYPTDIRRAEMYGQVTRKC